ncbi:uncharacterized mitochondrial protein-like protein [Tanacetum coccineum]
MQLLIALAAEKGWKIHHLDVKMTFLNGDRKKLDSTLKEMDDLFMTGTSFDLINEFKKRMASQFEILDLDELTCYLGIEVSQGKDCVEIKQERYVMKILNEAGMEYCNPALCPMEPGLKFSKAEDESEVEATQYQKMLGYLCYLLPTRPNLTYSVGVVSRYMQSPRTSHARAIKHILCYLKGTTLFEIEYKRGDDMRLVGYNSKGLQKESSEGRVFDFENDKKTFQRNRDDKKGKSDRKCFRCGDPNHLIGECPKPPKDKNQRAIAEGSMSDIGETRLMKKAKGREHVSRVEKGYDRFQQLLSELEAHGAKVSIEDANHKFLRSLPLAWSNLAMTIRTKPDVDTLSIDDLYNNLRVLEQELTSILKSSASAQNVAFVSHSKSSTNKVKSSHTVAYNTYTSTSSNNIQEREFPPGFADEVIYSLFAKQSEDLDLLHEDLE